MADDFQLPDGLAGSFEGLVKSHNGMAVKFSELLQQFQELQSRVQGLDEQGKATTTANDERAAQMDDRLKQMEATNASFQEEQKTNHEERVSKLEELQQESRTKLEEDLGAQFDGLVKSVKELADRQTADITETLPRWRAELIKEVQKLSAELPAIRTSVSSGFEAVDARLETLQAESAASLEQVNASLKEQLDAAGKRLDLSEAKLAALQEDQQTAEVSNKEQSSKLSERLGEAETRLEAKCVEEAAAAVQKLRTDWGPHLAKLQDVVKQAEYERLAFVEKVNTELETIRKDVESKTQHTEGLFQKQLLAFSNDLHEMKEELQKEFTEGQASLQGECKALKEGTAGLQQELAGVKAALEKDLAALRQKVDAGDPRVPGQIQAAVKSAQEKGRAELQEGLDKLHISIQEELQPALAAISEQIEAKKAEFLAQVTACDARVNNFELGMTLRCEGLRKSLDDLAAEFLEYVRAQASRDVDWTRLEAQIRVLESRLMPWKKGERASSPKQKGQEAEGDKTSQWLPWPKHLLIQPATHPTRPPSSGRFQGTASTLGEDLPQQPGAVYSCANVSPAGPALSAARASRVTGAFQQPLPAHPNVH